MQASILTIGDEIINGSITDTNSTFIAENATMQGIKISTILSVSDKSQEIINALTYLEQISDVIFITGGLGPTNDDITIKTLAKFLKVPLEFNQKIYDKIKGFLTKRKKDVKINKEQCKFPQNAILLNNSKGTAPCIWLKKDNTTIISMPGVPHEMKEMFIVEVLPKLNTIFKTQPIINKYILTAGIWESLVAKEIRDIEESLPPNISLSYLPKLGRVKLRLTGINVAEAVIQKYVDKITEKISKYIYSYSEKDTLEKIVGEKLLANNKTLSTAESCTGGKIAHKITSIAGSSNYFQGSIVSYSNEVKMKSLGVKKTTLSKFGAVSEQTVKEMAFGVTKALKTDYGIAVSGIAGPAGGTKEKPVGTVWIAIANKDKIVTKKFRFLPFREENIELSTVVALNMLLKLLN